MNSQAMRVAANAEVKAILVSDRGTIAFGSTWLLLDHKYVGGILHAVLRVEGGSREVTAPASYFDKIPAPR